MKLDSVSFSYGGRVVLDRFDLSIPDEGVTALSGPSGCGKTTLLRLLGGLERPSGGTVTAPGGKLTALLFQEDRLLPRLTAGAQLRAVLPRGTDVTGYLEAVGLGAEVSSRIETLSGGMRRRVAIARAMAYARDKELLILDEPFTGVDPENAGRIMERLRGLGIPIVFSAHDAESLALADRVIRLSGPPLRTV